MRKALYIPLTSFFNNSKKVQGRVYAFREYSHPRIKKVWGQGAFPKKALAGSRAGGPGRARRREIPSSLTGCTKTGLKLQTIDGRQEFLIIKAHAHCSLGSYAL